MGRAAVPSCLWGWRSAETLHWAAVVPAQQPRAGGPSYPGTEAAKRGAVGHGAGTEPPNLQPTGPSARGGGGGTALLSRLLPSNGGGSAGRSRPGGARGRRSRGDAGPGCGWMGLRGLLALLRAAAPSAGDEVGSHLLPHDLPQSPPIPPPHRRSRGAAPSRVGCPGRGGLGLRGQSGDNAGALRAAPGLRGGTDRIVPIPILSPEGGKRHGGISASQHHSPPPSASPHLDLHLSPPAMRPPNLPLSSSPFKSPPPQRCPPAFCPASPPVPGAGGGGRTLGSLVGGGPQSSAFVCDVCACSIRVCSAVHACACGGGGAGAVHELCECDIRVHIPMHVPVCVPVCAPGPAFLHPPPRAVQVAVCSA